MNEPGIVLLDEPTAGLDVGGREELVHDLTQWARDAARPPLVLVTHHLEEIPPGFTHALVMKDARVLTSGPLAETVTSEVLSEAFGIRLRVDEFRRPLRGSTRMNEPGNVIAERDRSIVTREDGVVRKRYRRPDPRNDVERAAYRHLSAYSAPVPRLIDATDDGIVLEAIANVGDYEAALRSGRAVEATPRSVVPTRRCTTCRRPARRPNSGSRSSTCTRGATRSVSPRPIWTGQPRRSMRRDRCSRSPMATPHRRTR